MMGSMVRFLGQLLAMFALAASAINAQCELTCSLQASAPVVKASHACCPGNTAQNRQQAPCTHTTPRTVALGLTASPQELPLLEFAALQSAPPVFAWAHCGLVADIADAFAAFDSPSSFFVLRV